MTRRNRRPDWRRIKALRSYTADEAAGALRMHRNSVRHWIRTKQLPSLLTGVPISILGSDLMAFLKGRRAAKKRKCGPGQFFCLKCREPQTRQGHGRLRADTRPERGVLAGICPVCGRLMRRFVRGPFHVVARDFGSPTRESPREPKRYRHTPSEL